MSYIRLKNHANKINHLAAIFRITESYPFTLQKLTQCTMTDSRIMKPEFLHVENHENRSRATRAFSRHAVADRSRPTAKAAKSA